MVSPVVFCVMCFWFGRQCTCLQVMYRQPIDDFQQQKGSVCMDISWITTFLCVLYVDQSVQFIPCGLSCDLLLSTITTMLIDYSQASVVNRSFSAVFCHTGKPSWILMFVWLPHWVITCDMVVHFVFNVDLLMPNKMCRLCLSFTTNVTFRQFLSQTTYTR